MSMIILTLLSATVENVQNQQYKRVRHYEHILSYKLAISSNFFIFILPWTNQNHNDGLGHTLAFRGLVL